MLKKVRVPKARHSTCSDMMIERIQSLSGKDGWKKPWFTEGTLQWPEKPERTRVQWYERYDAAPAL